MKIGDEYVMCEEYGGCMIYIENEKDDPYNVVLKFVDDRGNGKEEEFYNVVLHRNALIRILSRLNSEAPLSCQLYK